MDQENSSNDPAIVGDNWDYSPSGSLPQELLAEVFGRLPFEERLQVVPQVCKSWQTASHDSECWVVVDMDPWIHKKSDIDLTWEYRCEAKLDYLVKTVVDRSCGKLRELRTMYISDSSVDYIAGRCVFIFNPTVFLMLFCQGFSTPWDLPSFLGKQEVLALHLAKTI